MDGARPNEACSPCRQKRLRVGNFIFISRHLQPMAPSALRDIAAHEVRPSGSARGRGVTDLFLRRRPASGRAHLDPCELPGPWQPHSAHTVSDGSGILAFGEGAFAREGAHSSLRWACGEMWRGATIWTPRASVYMGCDFRLERPVLRRSSRACNQRQPALCQHRMCPQAGYVCLGS